MTLLAVVGAIFAWRLRTPEVSEAPPTGNQPPAAQTAAPTAPAPRPDPAKTLTFDVQLTTVRPVWLRVLVDGERTIEREVPAGQKIPLSARETVAVRAGDAGAVRVSVGGRDQGPLGADGAVASRTFTRGR